MYSYFLFLIYLIFILLGKNKSEKIEAKFPTTIVLPSGNLFVISSKGINVYNNNFNKIIFSYSFNRKEEINNYNEYKTITTSDYFYKNNYYFICLTKGIFFYLFDNNKLTINKATIRNITDGLYYNLIPYKYYDNNLEYIISYISYKTFKRETEYKINLLLFKLSFSEDICQNFLILNNTINNIK